MTPEQAQLQRLERKMNQVLDLLGSFMRTGGKADAGHAELLTVTEAAALIKRSPFTVRMMIKNNELPATKDGKRWLISAADVEAWLLGKGLAV